MSSSLPASPPYPKPCSVQRQHPIPALSFTSGFLAGLTVCTSLDEIQKADHGRKYARKDKRPLDPPPVVLCNFTSIVTPVPGSSTPIEHELDVEHASIGAVCHIDLFEVPENYEQFANKGYPEPPTSMSNPLIPYTPVMSGNIPARSANMLGAISPMPDVGDRAEDPLSLAGLPPLHQIPTQSMWPHALWPVSYLHTNPVPTAPAHNATLPAVQLFTETVSPRPSNARQDQSLPSDASDIVAWFGPFPIREGSKRTSMLAGATVTQAEIVDYNGKKQAMFVFSDLAVKLEGTFILRYRTTNVISHTASFPTLPILAECFGGPFRVYSTKEFPGLGPSTALTKLLSMYNIRVNLRENERKRRTKPEIEADNARARLRMPPPPLPTAGATDALAGPSSSLEWEMHSPTLSVASSAASSSSSPRQPQSAAMGRPGPRQLHGDTPQWSVMNRLLYPLLARVYEHALSGRTHISYGTRCCCCPSLVHVTTRVGRGSLSTCMRCSSLIPSVLYNSRIRSILFDQSSLAERDRAQ